ncbi:MAG: aminotransferase class I/II-fold pyridoxal phosphate-dependent enzyme [Microthrixaceae bacterium]|nr:aminotransferase class I/II-fold pyridoxal phosphate-dependent enzyme [Microthrixaceae bacterium]
MIPYGHQSIDESDIAAVVEVLRSDYLTQGPVIERFEAALCDVTGAKYAVAVASGTAALHAAAHVAGLGPGDLVVTSPLSFAASANAARYVGADVAFVDIDPATLNVDLEQVPRSVDGLIAVHYAGLPVDLAALESAGRRPRIVIEDAAHAIGAVTPDGLVGNCAHSDLCCFSFHPVKTVTTGEGGAITTNSAKLADALRRFRHHGIERDVGDPAWRYDIGELGWNYRLTDIAAALGASQLERLDAFLKAREAIADRYRAAFKDDERVLLPPSPPHGTRHGLHLFPIRVGHRDEIYEHLRGAGIGVQVHYVPTYRFSSFSAAAEPYSAFPETERAFSTLLSLPMYVNLSLPEQRSVIDELRCALDSQTLS